MNKQEFLLNKPLLKEINEKKKGQSQMDGNSVQGSNYWNPHDDNLNNIWINNIVSQ